MFPLHTTCFLSNLQSLFSVLSSCKPNSRDCCHLSRILSSWLGLTEKKGRPSQVTIKMVNNFSSYCLGSFSLRFLQKVCHLKCPALWEVALPTLISLVLTGYIPLCSPVNMRITSFLLPSPSGYWTLINKHLLVARSGVLLPIEAIIGRPSSQLSTSLKMRKLRSPKRLNCCLPESYKVASSRTGIRTWELPLQTIL